MTLRPNFIIIVADQLRADCVRSHNPDTPVHTPNLDRLAAGGVTFAQTFGQHSVCSPSRVSFLSGQYPHVAGHRTLEYLLSPDEPNFLRAFKDNGYRVAIAGARGDTFAAGATELSTHEHGFMPEEKRSTVREFFARKGDGDRNDPFVRAFYQGRRTLEQAHAEYDEVTIQTAEQWLANPPADPWVLYVPLFAPHPPFEVEEPWFSMYERSTVPLPNGGSGPKPLFMQELAEVHGWDRLTEDQWRELRAVYFGMVSRLDAHVGRLMDATQRLEQASNVVTTFFSDHGEYLGDYGLVEKWPSGVNECLLRNPLIVSGQSMAQGAVCDALVELIDVFPTLLEMADIKTQHEHYGKSFVRCLQDPGASHRNEVFSEGGFRVEEVAYFENAPFPYDTKAALQKREPERVGKVVALRDHKWTYVWRLYEKPELYHRPTDPHELKNLAGNPEYAQTEAVLLERVLRWLVATADVLPTAKGERFPTVNLPRPGEGRV